MYGINVEIRDAVLENENVIYVAKPHENQIPDDNTYALIQVDKAKLYVDDMHTPVLCVDHMKHGKDAEGYFKNLMIENVWMHSLFYAFLIR